MSKSLNRSGKAQGANPSNATSNSSNNQANAQADAAAKAKAMEAQAAAELKAAEEAKVKAEAEAKAKAEAEAKAKLEAEAKAKAEAEAKAKKPEIDPATQAVRTGTEILVLETLNPAQVAAAGLDNVVRKSADNKISKWVARVALGPQKGKDATHLIEHKRLSDWHPASAVISQYKMVNGAEVPVPEIDREYGYLMLMEGRGTKEHTCWTITESKFKKTVRPYLETLGSSIADQYAGVRTATPDRRRNDSSAQAAMVIGFIDQVTLDEAKAAAAKAIAADAKAAEAEAKKVAEPANDEVIDLDAVETPTAEAAKVEEKK